MVKVVQVLAPVAYVLGVQQMQMSVEYDGSFKMATDSGLPGSGLKTFDYPKVRDCTANPSGLGCDTDVKYWPRSQWDPVMFDIYHHTYREVKGFQNNTWFLGHDGRSTMAHEAHHAANGDVERYSNCGRDIEGLYLLDNKACCVRGPNIKKNTLYQYIPQSLRFIRYNLYIERINKNHNGQVLFNEWISYCTGITTTYNLYKMGKIPGQGNYGASDEDNSLDVGMGALEFLVYSFSVGIAAEAREPAWLTTSDGKQMKEFFGMMVARTFNAFCSMKHIHETKANQRMLPTSDFFKNHVHFQTSQDAQPFRSLGERWFGRNWWNKQMNCEATAAGLPPPSPPTPPAPTPTTNTRRRRRRSPAPAPVPSPGGCKDKAGAPISVDGNYKTCTEVSKMSNFCDFASIKQDCPVSCNVCSSGTPAPTPAPTPGSWKVSHANQYCSPFKRLSKSGTSVAQCKADVLKNQACSNVMFANGKGCACVEKGKDCNPKKSGVGNNVYEFAGPKALLQGSLNTKFGDRVVGSVSPHGEISFS